MTLDMFGLPEQPRKTDEGFDEFWSAYPACPRKGSKKAVKEKWRDTYCFTQKETILKHVSWLKTTEPWLKANGAFIPAPLVYLNQQRWDGAEVPEMPNKNQIDPALKKAIEDSKNAAPMPDHIRERLKELRGRRV